MEGLKQTIDRVISGMDMEGKNIIKVSVTTYTDNFRYKPQ